jgi:hypothetical protein
MGMKLAIEAKLIDFKLVEDKTVVVEKKPVRLSIGCALRIRRLGWRSSFLVRGGVKLFPADKLVEIGGKTYHVIAERRLRYGTVMIADMMLPYTRFENPLVLKQGYLTFDVRGNEAKLVDDEPTHVMVVFTHATYYRFAEIKVTGDVMIMFNDRIVCRQKSMAMAVAFAPYMSKFIVCYNVSNTKYKCQEMLATVPPAVQREFYA